MPNERVTMTTNKELSPDCIRCTKLGANYCLGKDEIKHIQCNNCIFDGKRECVYHGYPNEIIPHSCEYKIGTFAVIAPLEAQLHNQERDIRIKSIVEKKLLDALDKRCEIAAREYAPNPDKGEWASDSHRDPFNEVRE